MRIRSVGFIKGSSPWSPFHPWAVKVNERPEQQEADVRLYQTTPLSALFYCAIYTVNRLPWKKEQTYGRAKVTFWATHPSDSVVSLSRPKTHSPLLKKEKNAQLKGFVFNPLVLGQIVGGEIANSSWAKHLIPSCGRQIKPQFYWATSRCECEHGAGRFLLLLEPTLTQTLWTQWTSQYNTEYNGKQAASN